MAYNPSEQFNAGLIFKGITGAGDGIAAGIQDMIKKRKHEEEQLAFNQSAFQTLSNAKGPDGQPLLTEEEKQRFTSGNLNAKNGIVAAGGARLMQSFQTAKERQAMDLANLHKQLMGVQIQDAQKSLEDNPYANQPVWDQNGNQMGVYDDKGTPHYFPYGGVGPDGAGMTPYQQEQTRLRAMDIQRKANKSSIPDNSRAIARGRLNSKGEFDNNYPEAATGDMTQVRTPDGKTLVVPWDAYQRSQNPQQQSDMQPDPSIMQNPFGGPTAPPPSAPQAASGAAPVAPSADKFVVGKKYKDAQGNVATYAGNGQWQ